MNQDQDAFIEIVGDGKKVYYYKKTELFKISTEETKETPFFKCTIYFRDLTSDKGYTSFNISEEDYLKIKSSNLTSITKIKNKGTFVF